MPFCSPPGRAIIIESRFQTDKRSRKRDRASAPLLTRWEREGNIARTEDTNYTRMERVQRQQGATNRSTKGGLAGRVVGDADGRGGGVTFEGGSETRSSGVDDVNYDRARRSRCLCGFQKVKRAPRAPPSSSPPPPSCARSPENARAKFCSRGGAYAGVAFSAVR